MRQTRTVCHCFSFLGMMLVNYSVLSVKMGKQAELKMVQQKSDQFMLDFWTERPSSNYFQIMVPPTKKDNFKKFLNDNGLEYHIHIEDVQKEIENAMRKGSSQRQNPSFFHDYRSVFEIDTSMRELVAEHQDIANISTIGQSYYGWDLKVIKIGTNKPSKNAIWIDGGIHAREWLSIPTALYTATKLLEDFSKDKDVASLVDSFDWYIMPLLNPDGYMFSRQCKSTRLWRKNRSKNKCPKREEQGTDLNRNFPYHWNDPASKLGSDPCSDAYGGVRPFSEPEVKSMAQFLSRHEKALKLYFSLHQYGPTFLTPWSYDPATRIPDYNDLVALARKGVEALKSVRGTHYNVGLMPHNAYAAPGAADDFVYGSLGVKYTFTVEMTDNGTQTFLIPSEDIIPASEEMYQAIKAMALAIRNEIMKHS